MEESKQETMIELFVQDNDRVIGRRGRKVDETEDFLIIINEGGRREAISKRVILRFVEVVK